MEILPDASAGSLHRFLTRHVEPGATVITDGWMGYHGIAGLGYGPSRAVRCGFGLASERHDAGPAVASTLRGPSRSPPAITLAVILSRIMTITLPAPVPAQDHVRRPGG